MQEFFKSLKDLHKLLREHLKSYFCPPSPPILGGELVKSPPILGSQRGLGVAASGATGVDLGSFDLVDETF
jgi:hypothetical protein